MKLSSKRANAVKEYLISKGIKKSRLKTKGYGKSQLKNKSATEKARGENRRVEFDMLQ
jgi:OmpA-OmpF porin, OOP family